MQNNRTRRDFLKTVSAAGIPMPASLLARAKESATSSPAYGKYQPAWESLSKYEVPEWYRDAKFGIFLHWGIYAVPAYGDEWYPRNMYIRTEPTFEWHRTHWGPQSMFGYKDFIPLFRAERWKPEEWIALFKKADAKYVINVGEHHDGFPMYDSHLTTWSAAKMGPHRDVVGETSRELRNQRLKHGISSHRGFHWSYYTFKPDFDTSNPLYAGLYGPIHAPTPLATNRPGELRQIPSQAFLEDWFSRCLEIVNLYRPDLFYLDFGFEIPPFEAYRRQLLAYFYNAAERWPKEVVLAYNYQTDAYPEHAAVRGIERGVEGVIREMPWESDTSVSWKSWGYIENDQFKTAGQIIPQLVDTVSKNGNFVLNVGPKPDGTLPEEAVEVFHRIGRWMDVNGEAIFATRPWEVFGEGPDRLHAGTFSDRNINFRPDDIRFTRKGNIIYAIFLAWPEPEAKIAALGKNSPHASTRISRVGLLGAPGDLKWRQEADALVIQTPRKSPCDFAWSFRIETS